MKQKKRGSRLLATVPLSPGLKSKIILYNLSYFTYCRNPGFVPAGY